MQERMHIAMVRFGFGARFGQTVADDPDGWLHRQLQPLADESGLTTAQGLRSIRAQRVNPGP